MGCECFWKEVQGWLGSELVGEEFVGRFWAADLGVLVCETRVLGSGCDISSSVTLFLGGCTESLRVGCIDETHPALLPWLVTQACQMA